jgi:hypothetical protein
MGTLPNVPGEFERLDRHRLSALGLTGRSNSFFQFPPLCTPCSGDSFLLCRTSTFVVTRDLPEVPTSRQKGRRQAVLRILIASIYIGPSTAAIAQSKATHHEITATARDAQTSGAGIWKSVVPPVEMKGRFQDHVQSDSSPGS